MVYTLILFGTITTIFWSFFYPLWGSKVFLGFIAVFEGYIIVISHFGRLDHVEAFTWPFYFDPDEVAVVKKYHLFFRFPLASRELSAALSMLQISAFIWVPWMMYQGLWFTAIVIGVNYFIAGIFAMKLNPRLFLSRAKEPTSHVELMVIKSAFDKLTSQSNGK